MNKNLINSLSKLFDTALAELVHAAEDLNHKNKDLNGLYFR